MDIPSKWCAMVVKWGEKKAHIYYDSDLMPQLFQTESEAQEWGESVCRHNLKALVVVMKVERLLRAKDVEIESVAA